MKSSQTSQSRRQQTATKSSIRSSQHSSARRNTPIKAQNKNNNSSENNDIDKNEDVKPGTNNHETDIIEHVEDLHDITAHDHDERCQSGTHKSVISTPRARGADGGLCDDSYGEKSPSDEQEENYTESSGDDEPQEDYVEQGFVLNRKLIGNHIRVLGKMIWYLFVTLMFCLSVFLFWFGFFLFCFVCLFVCFGFFVLFFFCFVFVFGVFVLSCFLLFCLSVFISPLLS